MTVHRATWPLATALLIALAGAIGCQDSTDSRLQELQSMQQAGAFAETIEPLREILAEQPDNADANYLLGSALIQTGRASQAVLRLERAAQNEKYSVVAGVAVAAQLYNSSSYERAIETATHVLERNPELVTALQIRTRAELAAGMHEEALADAERLMEINPDEVNYRAFAAEALENLERIDEALALYAEMRDTAREAGEGDKEARSCGSHARLLGKHERHEEAEAAFDDCLSRFPTHGILIRMASEYFDEVGDTERGDLALRRAIEEMPDSLALRQAYAARLAEHGDLAGATAALEEATELFDTAEAWRALGQHRRTLQDWDGAVEAAERAIERAGRNPILLFELSEFLVQAGEVDRAAALADELQQPELAELAKAHVLLARGDAAGALAVMDEALVLWPNNEGGRMLAGRAAEALGDLDRALEEYREAYKAEFTTRVLRGQHLTTDSALSIARVQLARGDLEEAVSWVNVDLRNRPAASVEAFTVASRIAMGSGNYAKSRELLDQAVEHSAEVTPALVLERAGLERLASGPAKSLEIVETSGIDLNDPDHAQLLAATAGDLMALGRSDEAIARVKAAVAAHPEAAPTQDVHGRVLMQVGRTEEAKAAFDAAVSSDPAFAPAYEGLAVVALTSGDLAGGLELAERALVLDPARFEAAYLAGQALMVMGRTKEAEARFRRALALSPEDSDAANALAWLLAEEKRDLEYALGLAQRAVAVQPSAATLDTLGWVLQQLGQSQAAAARFKQSLAKQESPSTRYRLALALADAGEADAAKQALNEALAGEDFPESEQARAVLAKLDE